MRSRWRRRNLEVIIKNYNSAKALLAWYTIRAPAGGRILAIPAAVGSYVVTSQGTYDTYTQGFDPILVMGAVEDYVSVRCYIDEILIHRLKLGPQMQARMLIRGTNIGVPLQYVRVQPYVSPKIELSDERQERVDVRVLPVIFRFARRKTPGLPGSARRCLRCRIVAACACCSARDYLLMTLCVVPFGLPYCVRGGAGFCTSYQHRWLSATPTNNSLRNDRCRGRRPAF